MASPNPVTYFPGTTRRFAPGPWMYSNYGNGSSLQSAWDTWFEPYYRSWVNRNKGELPGIFQHAIGLNAIWVNRNVLPENPANPASWDWSYFNSLLGITPIVQGRATFNWRLDLEGKGQFPSIMESNGYTQVNSDGVVIFNWYNNSAVNFLIDVMKAYAAQFNNNDSIYTWSMSETSKSGSGADPGKIKFVTEAVAAVSKTYFYLFQNSSLWSNNSIRNHSGIGVGFADMRPFAGTCGDSAFPSPSCGSGGQHGVAVSDNCVLQNPPGPGFRAVFIGTESNGFNIIDDNHTLPNPFGVTLPHPSRSETGIDMDPFVAAWYCSYKPRAAPPKDDSNLGQNGTDPNGVIPATNLTLVQGGARFNAWLTPKKWDDAMRAFGAAGTQALFWPPFGFDAGGGQGDPVPFISSVGDGTFFNGETGIVITGDNFGSSQGNGWVRVYEQSNQTGDSQQQTVTNWASNGTSITITFVQGPVNAGPAYLFVQNNAGDRSDAFPITVQATSADPVIQSVTPSSIFPGLASVTIRGTNFEAIQGSVALNSQSDGGGTSVAQTVSFWSDTEAHFTVVQGALSQGTVYVFLTNNSANTSNGFAVTLTVTQAPTITNAENEDFVNGEQGVTVEGAAFETQGSNSQISLNSLSDGSGIQVIQLVASWTDTLITITINRGSIPQGDMYLRVRNNSGQTSAGYLVTVTDGTQVPVIDSLNPETMYDGMMGMSIIGSNFGLTQGAGTVEVNTQLDGTGVGSFQDVRAWNSVQIEVFIVRGNLPLGTVYVIVRNDAGLVSVGFPATMVDVSNIPFIDNIEDGIFYTDETGIVINGGNFNDPQSTGRVVMYAQANVSSANVEQTVVGWTDTQITFDIALGGIFSTGSAFIRVINSDAGGSGFFPITLTDPLQQQIVSTIDAQYNDTAGWSDYSSGGGAVSYGNVETTDYVITKGLFVTNVDAARPAVSDGDGLIVLACADQGVTPGLTISGTGWTKVADATGFGQWGTVWWKIVTNASGEPATYNVSKDTDQEDMVVAVLKVAMSALTNYTLASASDTTTTVCNSITPAQDNSMVMFVSMMGNARLPVNAGYPAGTTGSFYRNSRDEINNQAEGLGLAFLTQTTAQATGNKTFDNVVSTFSHGWALALAPPAGGNNAYNGAARTTPGDSSGDKATFTFNNLPAASAIEIYSYVPSPVTSWGLDTQLFVKLNGVQLNEFCWDQNGASFGEFELFYTFNEGPYDAGTLTIEVMDVATGTAVANAFRVEVTPAGEVFQEIIVETVTISDVPIGDLTAGSHSKGVEQAVVSLDAGGLEETIENLNTATLDPDVPGRFRVPIKKSFSKINEVSVTFVATGGGYSYTVDDKNVTLGPQVSIYRFNGTNIIAADALVDITVRGLTSGD